MTKKQAIEKSIKHWERMIEWVKKQPSTNRVNYGKMEKDIKEWWNSKDCSLCKKYYESSYDCEECPLTIKYKKCTSFDSIYKKIDNSNTWAEWLKHAKIMLRQLRSLRKL